MMHKSQFQKIDPYDWFCAPGSHILYCNIIQLVVIRNMTEDFATTTVSMGEYIPEANF